MDVERRKSLETTLLEAQATLQRVQQCISRLDTFTNALRAEASATSGKPQP